jgi:hypothetical protein
MQQPNETQVRETLAAAGNFRADPDVDLLGTRDVQQHRGEAEAAFRSLFADAGLDVERLERVQREYRSELERLAEERRLAAVDESSKSRDKVIASLNVRRGLIDTGGAIHPVGIKLERTPVMLDKPFLIQPTSAIVSGEQIAPFDSWAKTTFTKTTPGGLINEGSITDEGVSFYYMWENPNDESVNIDVTTSLGFYGTYGVHAEGSLFSLTTSKLYVFCALVVRPWSQQPEFITADMKDVLRREATSHSLLDGHSSGTLVHTQDLVSPSHSWIQIAARELVVFEVAAVFHLSLQGSGSVTLNFDDGYFAISSPFVSIGVWRP